MVLYDNDGKRDAPMGNQGSLKAAHTDLQVISAPRLALSQSLGLHAKDWGYPLREGKRLLSDAGGVLLGIRTVETKRLTYNAETKFKEEIT
ncbi:hypothetical protein A8L59_16445 [Pseudomonas koreensis]|uniref:Uncharacterized protein n=1 Tax=Pseudomonas koreensis TaxID=198620 RepID=A0AAC9FXQ0_9PSED|nr:hypothetical protein A8L59_16445 [Pseudomonas koreensis]